jgi:hypothetical protein
MADIERLGMESIKQGYDLYQEAPYWALFDIKRGGAAVDNLLFAYKGNDRDREGWLLLEENLKVAASTAPEVPLMIRFYNNLDKKERITNGSPYDGCFKLRMRAFDAAAAALARENTKTGETGLSMLKELFSEKLARIEDRHLRDMEDLERRHEQERMEWEAALEEQEEEEDLGIFGRIGAVAEKNEWLKEPLNQLATEAVNVLKQFGTFIGYKMNNMRSAAPGGINGVPGQGPDQRNPEAVMSDALKTLIDYNTRRFGWPAGTTPEMMAAATPEQRKEAYNRGYSITANIFGKMTQLTTDDDIYDLAIKKLNAL